MAYHVSIAARAEQDLARLYERINAADSTAARRWHKGLKQAILSLAVGPYRCSTTPESKWLRHLLYGRKPHVYRVIYRVLETSNEVEILHIRHGARRPFKRVDLS
jgi:plasmid stabilization system protein ParE